jgi:hypothetical protein
MRFLVLSAILLAGCASSSSRRAPEKGGEGGGGTGEGGAGGSGGVTMKADAAPTLPLVDAAAELAGPDSAGAEAGADSPVDRVPGDVPPDAPAALAACPKPSIDHLEVWEAHGGSLKPPVGGNLFVKEGDHHYVQVDFLPGGEWHEIVVPIVNALTKQTDLSASLGFTLTYSATADLWVQLRPLSHPHGGEQWTAKIPSTGGTTKLLFVPFAPDGWGMLLGTPPFPFAQALKDANFFNFVGPPDSTNHLVVRGLRIDGFVPDCS